MDDTPILISPLYRYPVKGGRAEKARPVGIDSHELGIILEGMAASPDQEVDTALAAARFYHAGFVTDGFRSVDCICILGLGHRDPGRKALSRLEADLRGSSEGLRSFRSLSQ